MGIDQDGGDLVTAKETRRASIDVDGVQTSYLTAGQGPVVLMLHGTYWSRVWLPVVDSLAASGMRPVAVDLPGLGRSDGELTPDTATVPGLAEWVTRFLDALGVDEPAAVAGHDIGGAIAQHLLASDLVEVPRLVLVNSVTYDSWPVPGVARYRDPATVAATSTDELLAARRQAITAALARPATDAELTAYLQPWTKARVSRSWMALAAAADNRYTQDLLPKLRSSHAPKLLVWGEDDRFQPIEYAERFATEIPNTVLHRIENAGHIPMENDPAAVTTAMTAFLNGRR